MPVTDSMAPIAPNTPSDAVAIRGPNRVAPLSNSLLHVSMVNGIAGSTSCNVVLIADVSCCGSRDDRTTSQVDVVGDWRTGKNIADCGRSAILVYFPSSTTP